MTIMHQSKDYKLKTNEKRGHVFKHHALKVTKKVDKGCARSLGYEKKRHAARHGVTSACTQ